MICWPQLEHCRVLTVCALDLLCRTQRNNPKRTVILYIYWQIQRFRDNFLGFSRLLRHLTAWFYLSDVRPGKRGWEVRPPALTYVPEPQERVSEKALRINLQLLRLSRHTVLYLFNHTCLWTINNFNRAHKYSARLTRPYSNLSQTPVLMYVWVCLHLWGNSEVFHLLRGVNLWSPGSVMRWDNLFGCRELAGMEAGSKDITNQTAQMTGKRVPIRVRQGWRDYFNNRVRLWGTTETSGSRFVIIRCLSHQL